MADSGKQTIKTALALVGLLGAGAFTFMRVFGDGNAGPKATLEPPEEILRSRPEPGPVTVESKRPVSETLEEKKPKALTWDDYLRYDPFEGRGNPSEEILALASGPSPFYAETIIVSQASGGRAATNPVEKMTLGAIVGSPEGRIAVIDNRPYRIGEYLLSKDGERAEDAEYGALRVTRIENDRIEVQAGGMSFALRLAGEEQALIRAVEDKKAAGKPKH